MNEYDNVISVSYDSVKGKFGIYIYITHDDAYCDTSHQIYIYNYYIESDDL